MIERPKTILRRFSFATLLLAVAADGTETSDVDSVLTTYAFQVEFFTMRIHYNEELSTFLNEKVKGEWYDMEGYNTRLIHTRLSKNDSLTYAVDFNFGASVDPSFEFYRVVKNGHVKIGRILGTQLTLPGDETVHVSGHTNSMFNKRRKFELKKGEIVEIAQPFYYVGIESKTTEGVHIYSDTSKANSVAYLNAGSQVTVLLNKGRHYLIETPEGLTGWLEITSPWEGPIKDIHWVGD